MEKKIKYSYFNDNFSIDYKNEKAADAMPPHTHNAVEFYLNLSYLPSVLFHSKVLPVKKDVLIIFPAYSIHQLMARQNEAYERYILTVNTLWLKKALNNNYERYIYLKDPDNPVLIPVTSEEKAKLIKYFDKLMNDDDHNTFSKLSCLFEAMSFIDNLFYNYTKHTISADHLQEKISIPNKTVNDIIEYINDHIHEKLQVMDIAEKFFLNPTYISRIFKKHTNTTISNYIKIQRIGKARQFLSEGYSVKEVQFKTGYSSYSYFFRTFKEMVGISPREFRDMHYHE